MNNSYLKLKNIFLKKNEKKLKEFNYGLAILKTILAFLVIVAHDFNFESTKNKAIIFITTNRKHHVPSFYIMSFYFMADNLLSLNFKILLKRLRRLLIPYIGWPIIFYSLNHFINSIFNKNLPASFEEFKMQILLGNKFIHPLWFQCDLMILTVLFFTIIFIFKKHSFLIFEILLILIYAVEYSGYDYTIFFQRYLGDDKYLLFYLVGSIPFTITGFILGSYKVIDILQVHKIKTFVLSLLLYKLIADYSIFRIIKNYPYPGIDLNVQSSCLVFIFSLFPSYYTTNKYMTKFLIYLTNYTAGVFYLHVPIHRYFRGCFYNIKKGTFFGMIQEYLICYFFCFFGMSIFRKTSLRYMFC